MSNTLEWLSSLNYWVVTPVVLLVLVFVVLPLYFFFKPQRKATTIRQRPPSRPTYARRQGREAADLRVQEKDGLSGGEALIALAGVAAYAANKDKVDDWVIRQQKKGQDFELSQLDHKIAVERRRRELEQLELDKKGRSQAQAQSSESNLSDAERLFRKAKGVDVTLDEYERLWKEDLANTPPEDRDRKEAIFKAWKEKYQREHGS